MVGIDFLRVIPTCPSDPALQEIWQDDVRSEYLEQLDIFRLLCIDPWTLEPPASCSEQSGPVDNAERLDDRLTHVRHCSSRAAFDTHDVDLVRQVLLDGDDEIREELWAEARGRGLAGYGGAWSCCGGEGSNADLLGIFVDRVSSPLGDGAESATSDDELLERALGLARDAAHIAKMLRHNRQKFAHHMRQGLLALAELPDEAAPDLDDLAEIAKEKTRPREKKTAAQIADLVGLESSRAVLEEILGAVIRWQPLADRQAPVLVRLQRLEERQAKVSSARDLAALARRYWLVEAVRCFDSLKSGFRRKGKTSNAASQAAYEQMLMEALPGTTNQDPEWARWLKSLKNYARRGRRWQILADDVAYGVLAAMPLSGELTSDEVECLKIADIKQLSGILLGRGLALQSEEETVRKIMGRVDEHGLSSFV